jgi:hypothetical protein
MCIDFAESLVLSSLACDRSLGVAEFKLTDERALRRTQRMMAAGRGLPRQRSRQQLRGQHHRSTAVVPMETALESTSVSIDIPEHVAILMDGLMDTPEAPDPF